MKARIESTLYGDGWYWRIVLVNGDRRVARINHGGSAETWTTEKRARAAARRVAKQLNLEVEE